jgi:prephenate dehydratase
LQSFPVSGSNFQYYFNADLEFAQMAQFIKINETLKKMTTEYKVLGVYKKGK